MLVASSLQPACSSSLWLSLWDQWRCQSRFAQPLGFSAGSSTTSDMTGVERIMVDRGLCSVPHSSGMLWRSEVSEPLWGFVLANQLFFVHHQSHPSQSCSGRLQKQKQKTTSHTHFHLCEKLQNWTLSPMSSPVYSFCDFTVAGVSHGVLFSTMNG